MKRNACGVKPMVMLRLRGGGWERLYAAFPVQQVFKWYFKVFVDYQQQIQIRHCT